MQWISSLIFSTTDLKEQNFHEVAFYCIFSPIKERKPNEYKKNFEFNLFTINDLLEILKAEDRMLDPES